MTEVKTKAEKSRRIARVSSIVITFVVIVLAVFFGLQLFSKTGVFVGFGQKPGQILFDDSATELNRDFVNTNTADLELKSDVTISAQSVLTKLPNDESHILYDILVPVTDFNNSSLSFTATDTSHIISSYSAANSAGSSADTINPPANSTNGDTENSVTADLVSIWDLTPDQKLLAIDSDYYLDTFSSGAFFQYFVLNGENPDDLREIAQRLRSNIATFPSQDTVLTLAQTGVTALSRRMNSYLDTIQNASFFSEKIGPFLSQFDYTHTSNESSFSNAASGNNICSNPAMIDVLTGIGLDIVELTGNHNQDCGDADALQTIEQYKTLGIQIVGGGASAAEAAVPLRIAEKGSDLTFLAYNLSTGGYTLDDTPGANFYTEEKVQSDIAAAKERGDFIIIDIQYYECNSYADTSENTTCDYADSSAGDQISFFRHLIDLGANIVVGTAAHQPQTYELYHNGAIYYGLGNLFFDQSPWPGTTRSLILVHYFYDGKLLQTRIVPTIYGDDFQTSLMDTASAEQFLARLIQAQPN